MDFSDSFDDLFPKGALDSIFRCEKEEPVEIEKKVWTVTEFLSHVNDIIDMEYGYLWIEGEIGNVTISSTGHAYFVLKDKDSSLKSVCFNIKRRAFSKHILEGTHVILFGKPNIYLQRGSFQVIVENVEPWGLGRLKLEFERLKKKLRAEGLFDEDRKKEIPKWPRTVFVVTSPTGAAIRDFIKTAKEKFSGIRIRISPSIVQGEDAPKELIKAIDLVEEIAGESDVLVITRGGGSLEDLWAFNDEALARRISQCKVPVISAIGHEIDYTICDLVADKRAATPTAAAQLVCPKRDEHLERLNSAISRLNGAISIRLLRLERAYKEIFSRLKDPRNRLIEKRLLLDDLSRRMISNVKDLLLKRRTGLLKKHDLLLWKNPLKRINEAENLLYHAKKRLHLAVMDHLNLRISRLSVLKGALKGLDPLSSLKKGFSIVYDLDTNRIVKDSREIAPGRNIRIKFSKGSAIAEVLKINEHED